MRESSENEETTVYLANMSTSLLQSVLEIADLVGVKTTATRDAVLLDAALVLTEPDGLATIKTTAPVITVSDRDASAELRLPGQAPELAQVLLSGAADAVADGFEKQTVFLAGWQGGVGVSTAASKLVGICGGLLLDASGNPPHQEVAEGDLHWGRIDAHDPPILGELTDGVRSREGVLSRLPDSVQVGDPRVSNLLSVIRGPAVVDAGTWRPSLEGTLLNAVAAGRQIRLVLVGKADTLDCLRLVNVLTSVTSLWKPAALLSAEKPGEQLELISDYWNIPLSRLPRNGWGSNRLWQRLWDRLWGDPR